MTKAKLLFKALVIVIGILNLVACGDPAAKSDFDELESEAPDVGLNLPDRDPDSEEFVEDEPQVENKVCLGKVVTESSNLNVRTGPSTGYPVCGSIPSQSYVTVLDKQRTNGFYEVTSDYCANETQFVFAAYIELGEDCFSEPVEGENPIEGGEPIVNLRQYIRDNLPKVSVVRELIRGGAKGRVEVHKLPGLGQNLMCGIKHIRSYRSEAFQAEDTLCAWTAVAQEWQQKYCPGNSKDCRIMLGDSTFGERIPSSWPHSTHRRGWCMDIWPMRKDSCGEVEVSWKQSCYSRTKTAAFVKLLIKHGADKGNQLFFNDPQIPDVRYLSNHDDHIHVCFKPSNSIVKSRCDNTQVSRQICPEF